MLDYTHHFQRIRDALAGYDLPARVRDGMEGVIAKKAGSTYRSGRCSNWLNIKNADFLRR